MTKTRKNKKKSKNSTYSKKDYESGDGMLTTVWGPGMWHYLHTMSFNYPNKPTIAEKKYYKDFVLSLKNVLPCKYCRINLKENFKKLPLKDCDMKDRYSFSKYIYDLHEQVNKMLKKQSGLSYCKVRERYEHFRARCTKSKPTMYKFKGNKTKKHKGCTEPLYGKKAKTILKIVPQDHKCKSLQIHDSCIKKRG